MDLQEMRQNYINEGYDFLDASAKVCQDILLAKISKSALNRNITIKGGVVMHNISKDSRRATRDLDLDFIKYSLDDKSIKNFIEKLNYPQTDISINIIGKIEALSHQDYNGKRVYIEVKDKKHNKIETKLDIGVHKNFDIEQDEYCFDLNNINESVTLLINSKEQIFTEKLKSLLKFGFVSTRYKDIFDFYYLINNESLSKDKLLKCFDTFIFSDETMKENNLEDIFNRLKRILHNKNYLRNLNTAKNNWLELPIEEVIKSVLDYFETLQVVEV